MRLSGASGRPWKILFLVLGLATGLLACSGSSDSDPENDTVSQNDTVTPVEKEELPLVNEQSRMTPDTFMAQVNANAGLTALWNRLSPQGYSTFRQAGITRQDDGLQVMWGEVAGDLYDAHGLVQHCMGNDCVQAIWILEDGSVRWEDENGAAIEPVGVGLPVLLKQLAGHTYDKPTRVITQGLDVVTELPDIDVSKRRLHVVSSLGPLWANGALVTDDLVALGQQSGAFGEIRQKDYVHGEDIDDILGRSHPFDAMVWLAQGIREEAKTNEQYKPIGLTVNAGLFGDELYDRDRFEEVLDANPLQGPGLMVLAACESMGDMNGGGDLSAALPVLLNNGARVLVGFQGCTDARDILEATRRFLGAFWSGLPVSEALDAANDYLAGVGGAVMVAAPGTDLTRRFLVDVDGFWDSYVVNGPPEASTLSVNINIANRCVNGSGDTYQEDESFATAWSKEILFDGPFFQGSRQNPVNQVDLTITGALVDIRPGAHFFFVVEGSLGPKVQNITLYGDGVIEAIVLDKEKPDQFTITYKGQGVASAYTNEAGDECIMQPPLLVTTTGEPSSFVIPMAWAGER